MGNARSKYPSLVGTRIDSCSLCHTSSIPSLNPFGSAYRSNGRNVAAFGAIESADSDQDGATNLVEIMALTFPGDPGDRPVEPTNTPAPTVAPTVPPTVVPTVPPTVPPTLPATVPATAAATSTPQTYPPPGVTSTPLPTIAGTALPTLTFTPIPSGTPSIGPTATATDHCHSDDCKNKKHGKNPPKHKRHRHRHNHRGR
jgi:hypothetical protein